MSKPDWTYEGYWNVCPTVALDKALSEEWDRVAPLQFPARRMLRECVKVEWLGRMCIHTSTRAHAMAALKAIDSDDFDAMKAALNALRSLHEGGTGSRLLVNIETRELIDGVLRAIS